MPTLNNKISHFGNRHTASFSLFIFVSPHVSYAIIKTKVPRHSNVNNETDEFRNRLSFNIDSNPAWFMYVTSQKNSPNLFRTFTRWGRNERPRLIESHLRTGSVSEIRRKHDICVLRSDVIDRTSPSMHAGCNLFTLSSSEEQPFGGIGK